MLDAAVQLFWKRGYDGTSIGDLADAMGLARPSLYGAFGSKEGLYLEALSHYAATTGSAAMRAFETEPDLRKAVEALLRVSLEGQACPDTDAAQGCLLGNCAPAALDAVPASAETLRNMLEATRSRIAERFDKEKANGSLPADFPSEDRADLLFDFIQAQAYRARIGDTAGITGAIPARAKMVLG
ncbi:MAG: helix-turn-helix domain-containing protein [Pseudomonadota bacterium]